MLTKRKPLRSAEELAEHTLLHDAHNFAPSSSNVWVVRRILRSKGSAFRRPRTRSKLPLRGGAIALTNKEFVERDLDEGRLDRVLDGSLQGPANFYLVWQSYRKSPAIAALVDWLIAEVGTTPSKV
ncbi:LysR substrate-binding domain-containing protein [Rhizobium sp. PP-CC-3G-465]|uniref:LysR substrate-binding domain-containing protein n=1 Tax=Rhizobium sp. PP-CC-3G-465 TaxID=2135648 RepID=UPI001046D40D